MTVDGNRPPQAGGLCGSLAPHPQRAVSSTTSGVPETGLSVPDIPTDTLYVTFQEGIVTNMELESQRK